jgi:hypothetical protein
MQACYDDTAIVFDPIPNAVREALNIAPPHIFDDFAVR